MLQYNGNRQPPRPYPLPKDTKPDYKPQLCRKCQTKVWTTQLLEGLVLGTAENQTSFGHAYVDSAQAIRLAAIEGCPWCRGLANGIHTRVYLDSVYDNWAEGSEEYDSDIEDSEQDNDLDMVGKEEETESEDGPQITNGQGPASTWYLDPDHDTLAYECQFQIELSFELSSDRLYKSLKIHLVSITGNQEHMLTKLTGDRAVELRYHLHGDGIFLHTWVRFTVY